MYTNNLLEIKLNIRKRKKEHGMVVGARRSDPSILKTAALLGFAHTIISRVQRMDRKRENVQQVAVLNVNMLCRCQSHVQWGEYPNTRQLAYVSVSNAQAFKDIFLVHFRPLTTK